MFYTMISSTLDLKMINRFSADSTGKVVTNRQQVQARTAEMWMQFGKKKKR